MRDNQPGMMQRILFSLLLVIICAACEPPVTATLPVLNIEPEPIAVNATTGDSVMIHDVMDVHSGICFEAAFDARERVFIFHSPEEHIRFYDLADHSELCRRPVERRPFDFADGRVLAGLWSYGYGCTARHDIQSVERDDAARRITITAAFSVEGDCPYELIRPLWLGIADAAGYEIDLRVIRPESETS